jgi:hypothetical protein
MMSRPTYVIAASVPTGNRIRGFFEQGPDSVRSLLEHPPVFRWAGFDLTTRDTARLIDGTKYEVSSGDRKKIQLFNDGTLLFRAAADSEFLGWGQEPEWFRRDPRLNPLAVVEANTSFVHLYSRLLPHFVSRPVSIQIELALRNAEIDQNRIYLTEFYRFGIQNIHKPHRYLAHSINMRERIDIPADEMVDRPNEAAYKVVLSFSTFFDFPAEKIPFVVEGAIEPSQFER